MVATDHTQAMERGETVRQPQLALPKQRAYLCAEGDGMCMHVNAQTHFKAESDLVRKRLAGKSHESDEAAAQDKQAAGGDTRLRTRKQQGRTRDARAH